MSEEQQPISCEDLLNKELPNASPIQVYAFQVAWNYQELRHAEELAKVREGYENRLQKMNEEYHLASQPTPPQDLSEMIGKRGSEIASEIIHDYEAYIPQDTIENIEEQIYKSVISFACDLRKEFEVEKGAAISEAVNKSTNAILKASESEKSEAVKRAKEEEQEGIIALLPFEMTDEYGDISRLVERIRALDTQKG